MNISQTILLGLRILFRIPRQRNATLNRQKLLHENLKSFRHCTFSPQQPMRVVNSGALLRLQLIVIAKMGKCFNRILRFH